MGRRRKEEEEVQRKRKGEAIGGRGSKTTGDGMVWEERSEGKMVSGKATCGWVGERKKVNGKGLVKRKE